MFEGLSREGLPGALEALLFVTDEPVGALTLAEMVECDTSEALEALEELRDRLESEGSGIRLAEVAGGWRLLTAEEHHELIERYVLSWDTRKLSAAAMETLAIIAYAQPVTRAGVAQVRGVNSDSAVASLLEKGLLREMGNADAPGNPTLYGTSRAFLERFGLRSVKELPDLEDFAPDEETRRLIAERLSATRQEPEVSDEAARAMAAELLYDADELVESLVSAPMAAAAQDAAGAIAEAGVQELADASLAAALGQRREETIVAEDAEERAYEAMPAPRPSDTAFASAIASAFGVVDKVDFDKLEFDTEDE